MIALTVLHSAYMAEIYRSAISAVDPGQREAATSLGFGHVRGPSRPSSSRRRSGSRSRRSSISSSTSSRTRRSSRLIGTTDLMGAANQLNGVYRAPFELYTLVGFIYLTLVLVVSAGAALLERRLNRHGR